MKLIASTASRAVAVAELLGAELGDVIDQDRADAELAERIGAIGRDRKNAARAEQVDGVRLGQHLDGARQFLGPHRVAHPLQGNRRGVE